MEFYVRKTDDMPVKFVHEDFEGGCEKIRGLMDHKIFTAKNGETYVHYTDGKAELFVGVGKEADKTVDSLRVAGKKAGDALQKIGATSVLVKLRSQGGDLSVDEQLKAIAEGLIASTYAYEAYKKEKTTFHLKTVNFLPEMSGALKEEDLRTLSIEWDGVFFARDLVNTPAGDMFPEVLAEKAKTLESLGVDVTVYDRAAIEKMGMHAFLSVARGSSKEPRFIVMEYGPKDASPIVLVGKGLTYDSGGYSLKPSDGMKTMKADMGGSAAVIGAIRAIAEAKLDKHVVGIVAACENMVSGDAYKPGDVIPSLKGLTIEVDNTDAEGRLTLADAVCYGERTYHPSVIVDLATLTGACVVALGEHTSGVLGNCDREMDAILEAARLEGEKAWKLPYNKDFIDLNKSDIADIKNTGGRFGGASSAGAFVGAFIDDTPWVHIDIAGPAYNSKPYLFEPQGGTGHMVKTLFRYVKDR